MKHNELHIKSVARQIVREEGIVNLSRATLCLRAGLPQGSFDAVMGCNFQTFREQMRIAHGDGPENAPITVRRASKGARREAIISTAVRLAADLGYQHVTRAGIAEAAGVSPALVTLYAQTMPQLRRDIMRRAVREEVLAVIAQGLVARDPHALKASPTLQRLAMDAVIS